MGLDISIRNYDATGKAKYELNDYILKTFFNDDEREKIKDRCEYEILLTRKQIIGIVRYYAAKIIGILECNFDRILDKEMLEKLGAYYEIHENLLILINELEFYSVRAKADW